MSKKFFVYGTLKVGGHYAEHLDHIRKSVVPASLPGFDLFGVTPINGAPPNFPAAVKGTGRIEGEIHEFTDDVEALNTMDMIEGFNEEDLENSLYIRNKVEVDLKTGDKETVFVYLFNRKIQDYYPKMKEWAI